MIKEFQKFIARGNVLDLAVAVIIGAAFGKIVSSLTDDVIMPVVGMVSGGLDFSSHFIRLGAVPADYHGSLADYAALKKAGVSLIGWGQFCTQVVDFLIVAFVVFLIVRYVNKAVKVLEHEPVEVAQAPDSPEVLLLREIRDELRGRAEPMAGANTLPLEGQ